MVSADPNPPYTPPYATHRFCNLTSARTEQSDEDDLIPDGAGTDGKGNLLNDILDEDDLLDWSGDEGEDKLARQNSRDSIAMRRQKSTDR